ncbi:hypothetical protein QTP88_005293 [Uroleucon formosanum]
MISQLQLINSLLITLLIICVEYEDIRDKKYLIIIYQVQSKIVAGSYFTVLYLFIKLYKLSSSLGKY